MNRDNGHSSGLDLAIEFLRSTHP